MFQRIVNGFKWTLVAAIIVENTNPMLEAIVSDFKQTAESLTGEKP